MLRVRKRVTFVFFIHDSYFINMLKFQFCARLNYFCTIYRRKKEGRNVLFNDALNTFYLRLYGVRHMVKDNTDSERGNPLPPHGRLFPISSKFFYMHRITHTTAFVTPVVGHWL